MPYRVLDGRPLQYGHSFGGFSVGAAMVKAAGKYDLFGTRAKAARKAARDKGQLEQAMQAQEFEQQRVLTRDQAVENFRAKIVAKLRQVEDVAMEAAAQVEKARSLAAATILQGDPVLREVEEQLADMETSVVRIQTGTVIDPATSDTHGLAVSYSDAQAALVAMDAVRNRAAGVVAALEGRIVQLKKEQIRIDELLRQQAVLDKREEQRRAERERKREIQLAYQGAQRETQQRALLTKQLRELDREINREKRALRRARADLANYKARLEEQRVRAVATAARLAEFEGMRTGFRVAGLRSA